MNITKNWFYKLSELFLPFTKGVPEGGGIIIWNNLVVSIFDDVNNSIDIDLWENSRLDFYWFIEKRGDININFIQNKDNSILKVNYLLLAWVISPLTRGDAWKAEGLLKAKLYSKLSSNNSKSNIEILSIVQNDGMIDLDGVIEIDKGIEKVDVNLEEENLFLWDTGQVKWVPTLLVRSDDVKASHACKMERISDEKLFYLRSRWIWKENALSMMIEAKVKNMFSCISMLDNTFYEKLLENILERVR